MLDASGTKVADGVLLAELGTPDAPIRNGFTFTEGVKLAVFPTLPKVGITVESEAFPTFGVENDTVGTGVELSNVSS